jgi:hypothetical protein
MGAWTGFIWPRTGACFGSLWTLWTRSWSRSRSRSCKFMFPWHNGRGIFSFLALQLSVSKKCSLQSVTAVVTLGDKTYVYLFMCRTFGVYTLMYKQSSSPLNSFLNTSSWAQVGPSTRASLMPSQESAGWGAYRRLNCQVSVSDLNTAAMCRPLDLNIWPWSIDIFVLITISVKIKYTKKQSSCTCYTLIIIIIIIISEWQVVLIHAITPWMRTGGLEVYSIGPIAPLNINLNIRRRWEVGLTPWPLYPWESPQCLLTKSYAECYPIYYSHSVGLYVLLLWLLLSAGLLIIALF